MIKYLLYLYYRRKFKKQLNAEVAKFWTMAMKEDELIKDSKFKKKVIEYPVTTPSVIEKDGIWFNQN